MVQQVPGVTKTFFKLFLLDVPVPNPKDLSRLNKGAALFTDLFSVLSTRPPLECFGYVGERSVVTLSVGGSDVSPKGKVAVFAGTFGANAEAIGASVMEDWDVAVLEEADNLAAVDTTNEAGNDVILECAGSRHWGSLVNEQFSSQSGKPKL